MVVLWGRVFIMSEVPLQGTSGETGPPFGSPHLPEQCSTTPGCVAAWRDPFYVKGVSLGYVGRINLKDLKDLTDPLALHCFAAAATGVRRL